MKRRALHNRGFTLIELMVVMGIISLLSSVVLVGVRNAKTKADTAAYAKSIESLHTAIVAYKLNHNDQLPPCPGATASPGATFLNCFDFGGFSWLDDAFKPLVDEQLIDKIPHYAGWPYGSSWLSPSWAFTYYMPNSYNQYGVNDEFACHPVNYADWKLGSLPGVMLIYTSEELPFTNGYTQCDDVAQDCFNRYPAGGSGMNVYCLPLDLQ